MSRRRRTESNSVVSDRHFIQLMEWLAMESEAEIARMAERRRRRNHRDAERSGETLLGLEITDSRSGLGGRYLVLLAKSRGERILPWHRLRSGTPVVLSQFPEDVGNGLSGVVSRTWPDRIEVAFERYPEGRLFRLDLTADEVTRQRQLAAITTVQQSRGRLGELRQILMGEREPRFGDWPEVKFLTDLNRSQQEAVRFALSAEDLAVIHGPPGTGKTTAVVEVIVQAVRRGDRVLAAAPSNTAVDNLLERLVEADQRVVRIGHPARVDESLQPYTLDGRVEASEEMNVIRSLYREAEELFRQSDRGGRRRFHRGQQAELRREARELKAHARQLERHLTEYELDRADIVCTTCTFNETVLGDRTYDLAVIDEAGQSVEPASWFPLQRCGRVVFAGDHLQLPPTVLSKPAAREGFAISLMERQLRVWGDSISRMLEVQYRMHDQIKQFSSDWFYEGRLESDRSVATHRLCDLEHVRETDWTRTPVTFCDTAGGGWEEELEPEGESRRNVSEAAWVLERVADLEAAGVRPSEIAVIAPYAAQVRWLRRHSSSRSLEIDTVDGFQGREKEAVIISCVRSNSEGEIGFLGDERRMNVALTRARRKLIVIGDSATLGTNEFFRSLLDYFESIGAYTTIWDEAS